MTFLILKKVFLKPVYLLIASLVGLSVFMLAVWAQNLHSIWNVVSSSSISISQKVSFLSSFVGSIQTNFTLLSASYIIINAVLFGINVALVVYYIRIKRSVLLQTELNADASSTGAFGMGIGGLFSAILGIGCAACGSIILTPLLALVGASGLLAVLPLAGGEFGILGGALLLFSIYLVLKKIKEPLLCIVR